MKILLAAFVVIVTTATFLRGKPISSPTHYAPYKKLWYQEFDEPGRDLRCEVCDHTWDTTNWSTPPGELSPFSYTSRITLFCSMKCRNQWQLTRKVR